MIKFKITPDRFAEACSTLEYLNVQGGSKKTALLCLPRFLLDESGEYAVKVTLDEDGDPKFEGANEAFLKIVSTINPKRLEKLETELCEAARVIVNPPKGTG